MNMAKITCPSCQSVGQMSLLDKYYKGPYRCWKCRGNFVIEMEDNDCKSCTPISQAEFDRFKEEKAARERQGKLGR
jgi:transposase-like protein